ncbi:hypothetical protein RIF29_29998 [Crotalaria pallida]|uniref:C2H2-type domain-containing protein n=1 Tax=Crotalaria pallida TaxID=3830 RepID=A0AAN9EKP8_CROPI
MYKHKCKLCLRRFSNGRALGGHMRSHMMNLPLPTKPLPTKPEESFSRIQLSFEAESTSSSSSEEEGGNNYNDMCNDDDDVRGVCYGLRENPKMNVRLEDPEFSSVILQERESVTESSSNSRSRRTRKLAVFDNSYDCNNKGKQVHEREAVTKKIKLSKAEESWVVDREPLSPASDVSTDEEVAFCLMMLSRDMGWKRQKDQEQFMIDQSFDEEANFEDEDDDEEDEAERFSEDSEDDATEEEEERLSKNRVRGRRRYKCETCNKVFRSYQALGGHRASHKKVIKVKISRVNDNQELENENGATSAPTVVQKKVHECPVCFRVFASGQALGGHKRTHGIGLAAAAATTTTTQTTQVPSRPVEHGNNLIDLNLPASFDADDVISQIENSSVSVAEFVKTH